MIKHIVMWKFKENEEENVEKFLTGLKSLDDVIDVIKYMEVKRSVKPNSKYDAVLISKFDNFEDLEKYKNDPRHVEVSNLCKSIRTDRASIDVEE